MRNMSNESFLDIAILVVVALESYFAIVAALKSRSALKSRRKRGNLKSVLNFVTPNGVLSTKPLTIPIKRARPSKIRFGIENKQHSNMLRG
jgi:hypothetical protein